MIKIEIEQLKASYPIEEVIGNIARSTRIIIRRWW